MARVRKLFTFPLRVFSLYAFIVLLISIPIYHLVLNHIWIDELDEHHAIVVNRVKSNLEKISEDSVQLNQFINYTTLLEAEVAIRKLDITVKNYPIIETDYQKDIADDQEMERYRVYRDLILLNAIPYEIRIETNIESEEEIITSISLITALFFIVLIAGFIFINYIISKKVWHPFDEILKTLAHFRLNEGKRPVFDRTRIKEFNVLQEEVDKLMQSSIAAYVQQKQFLENASHEMQTPIAILLSKVEQLNQTDLSAEQRQKLSELENALSRLKKLNKNMLLLAQLENQVTESRTGIDLKEQLNTILTSLSDFISTKDQEIVCHFIESEIVIDADQFQLETLLINLITNAIKYTEVGGKITISADERSLMIRNPGNSALDKDHVFERFTKNSKKNGNIGLGLAIVKVICEKSGWSISYDFKDNAHIFSVQFN